MNEPALHKPTMSHSIPRSPWFFALMTLAGLALFGFATGVVMAPHAKIIGERLPELTCLQVAFTPARLAATLGSFTEVERAAIAQLLIPGDLWFAAGYGLMLTGLLGLLTLRLPVTWQPAGRWLLWSPLAAAGLDVVEDLFLHSFVTAYPGPVAAALPAVSGIATTLKYLLLSGIGPVYGIVGSLKGLRVDRRWGALLVYLLVTMNAVAFLLRPLQQIPACF